jgi:uncharacterized protein
MSNAATVGQIYEAFGRGDVPFILGCLADDVVWEDYEDWSPHAAGTPHLARRQGPAEVAGFFQIIGGWEFKDFQVRGIMDGGDMVAAACSVRVVAEGKDVADEEIHLWQFREDGKVHSFRHYVDTAKHMAIWQD